MNGQNESQQARPPKVFRYVISAAMVLCVSAISWGASCLVEQGKLLAVIAKTLDIESRRVDEINKNGSPSLLSHELVDNERVADIRRNQDRIDSAVQQMSRDVGIMAGTLKEITGKADAIKEAQMRLERTLQQFGGSSYSPSGKQP